MHRLNDKQNYVNKSKLNEKRKNNWKIPIKKKSNPVINKFKNLLNKLNFFNKIKINFPSLFFSLQYKPNPIKKKFKIFVKK